MCIRRERFILRNWLTQLWRLGKSKIYRVGQQLETQGIVTVCGQRPSARRIPSCFREVSLFLLRPSNDCMRPTHILEEICFPQSLLIYMFISSQKHFHRNIRVILHQIFGHHGPAKGTHKISHYNLLSSFFVLINHSPFQLTPY